MAGGNKKCNTPESIWFGELNKQRKTITYNRDIRKWGSFGTQALFI